MSESREDVVDFCLGGSPKKPSRPNNETSKLSRRALSMSLVLLQKLREEQRDSITKKRRAKTKLAELKCQVPASSSKGPPPGIKGSAMKPFVGALQISMDTPTSSSRSTSNSPNNYGRQFFNVKKGSTIYQPPSTHNDSPKNVRTLLPAAEGTTSATVDANCDSLTPVKGSKATLFDRDLEHANFRRIMMMAERIFEEVEPEQDDEVLPCGLTQRQVLDLLFRDIDPEDYETLKMLDSTIEPKTVSKETIDKLPKISIKEVPEDSRTCGVCLLDFDSDDVIAKTPCDHYFHEECISKWLSECNTNCPFCLKEIEE